MCYRWGRDIKTKNRMKVHYCYYNSVKGFKNGGRTLNELESFILLYPRTCYRFYRSSQEQSELLSDFDILGFIYSKARFTWWNYFFFFAPPPPTFSPFFLTHDFICNRKNNRFNRVVKDLKD